MNYRAASCAVSLRNLFLIAASCGESDPHRIEVIRNLLSSIQRRSHALFHNLHTEYNTAGSTSALEAALLILTRRSASTTSKALPTGSCRGHAPIRRRWGLDEESDQGH